MRIVCVIVLLVLGCCRAQNEETMRCEVFAQPWDIIGLVLITLITTSPTHCTDIFREMKDDNTSLIQDLRKKLIHNNYDYIPSSFEVTTKRTFYKKVVYGDVQNDPKSGAHVFVPDTMKAKHKTAIANLFDGYAEIDEVSNTTVATTIKGNTTASVKLRVITVKDLIPSRRGGDAFRQVIQQEDANGVVLVSLDGHPLPQFRLPNDRRQYMQEESRSRSVDDTKQVNYRAQKKSQVHDRDVSLPTDDDKKDVPLLPSQRQHPENKTRFDIVARTDARRQYENNQQLESEGLEDKASLKKCQDVLKNCFDIVIEDDSVTSSKDLREEKNDDHENSSVYKLRSVPDQKDAEVNGASTLRRVRSGGGGHLKHEPQKHHKKSPNKKVLVVNKKMLRNLNFKSDGEMDRHRASNLNNRKRVIPAPLRDMIYNKKPIARNKQRKKNRFFLEDSYGLSEESDLYALDTSISKHFILGRNKEIQNRRVKNKPDLSRHRARKTETR